jgi:hypothetical protein
VLPGDAEPTVPSGEPGAGSVGLSVGVAEDDPLPVGVGVLLVPGPLDVRDGVADGFALDELGVAEGVVLADADGDALLVLPGLLLEGVGVGPLTSR